MGPILLSLVIHTFYLIHKQTGIHGTFRTSHHTYNFLYE